ncbi:tagaturonate reductase [Arcticibacter tournemirensis]|uniref:Tagaturonate reductase n=1 Tax=Arcticibacter tournemirensis TaxID=699437 RepID=A0A5M9H8F9_9SPHI|nr:tagaturonate reductase [Arcticibacter tournemirensis]KAA8481427.1 tagaturonate reductase [Arcticibacter tournemirensis]TQM49014.1 tagaturonate reductase [Arcticibacter tournemirensis]
MQLSKKTFQGYREYPEKVLQFGEGNFLRCFVDWMFHELNKKADFNGSVVAVQPIDKGMVNLLNEQDGLYTLYLRGLKDGKPESTHETIDVISRGINPYEDFSGYLQTAENPDMRYIISNTTEAGIAYDENDVPTATPPNSYPAKLTVWLNHRYTTFAGDQSKGVHIIPCELIEKNADNLKRIILQLAAKWNLGEGFVNWLNTACTFSNTLVDRIVPGYPRERIAEITEELGYEDKQVVEGEHFHLWVIEAPEELQKELPFPSIGLDVLYVKDVTPYKSRKVRILNGAHTALVPVAYLYGIDTVRESVEHPVVGKFIKEAIFDEIIPTLDLPKAELEKFAGEVIERFSNPYIKHLLMSIALNSFPKFETRVLPSILEYKKRTGGIPQKLAFSLAATIAFYKGKRGEEAIALNDDAAVLVQLKGAWAKYDGDDESLEDVVREVLSFERNWKMDLNKVEGLTEAVTKHLINIEKNGMQKAIETV